MINTPLWPMIAHCMNANTVPANTGTWDAYTVRRYAVFLPPTTVHTVRRYVVMDTSV